MLEANPGQRHIAAEPGHVVSVLQSRNSPLVNIPGFGAAPTSAFVVGVGHHPALQVFVLLQQPSNPEAILVYVSKPAALTADQFRAEHAEAVRFLEGMTFDLRDLGFRGLSVGQKEAEMARIGVFVTPEAAVLELVDALPHSPPTSPRPSRGADFAPVPDAEGFVGAPTIATELREGGAVPGAQEADPALLARLGRLFSTFAVLAALLGTLTGCSWTQNPENPVLSDAQDTELRISAQHIGQGQYAEAISVLLPLLEEAGPNRDVLHNLALAYMKLGRADQAEEYAGRAVRADPKWSIAKNTLAALMLERSACTEAEALLLEVREDIFYPTPTFAGLNLARAMACQGRRREAVQSLDALTTKHPRFCLGYLTLAQIAEAGGLPVETIQACESFEKRCAEDPDIRQLVSPEHRALCYLKSGLAYVQLGQLERARRSFGSCASDGPNGQECQRSLKLLLR